MAKALHNAMTTTLFALFFLTVGGALSALYFTFTHGQPKMFIACLKEGRTPGECRELLKARFQSEPGWAPMVTPWEGDFIP